MDRSIALIITLVIFLVYLMIGYFGISVTPESSVILATVVSLACLNLMYPLSRAAKDTPDYSLVIYVVLEVLFLLLIGVYVVYISLNDVREDSIRM